MLGLQYALTKVDRSVHPQILVWSPQVVIGAKLG